MKPSIPQPTRCASCGRIAAEVICSLCEEPRPEYLSIQDAFAQERGFNSIDEYLDDPRRHG